MSKELIEAAKAVVDAHYASGGLRTEYLSGKGWRSWVTLLAALRSAVERAEAEPDGSKTRLFAAMMRLLKNNKLGALATDPDFCELFFAATGRTDSSSAPAENVDEARVEQAARAVDTLVMGERGWHWIDMCNTLRPYVLPSPAPRQSEEVRRVPIEDDEPYDDWHKEAVALAAGVIVDSEESRNAYVNGIIEGRRIAWSRRSLPAPQPGTVAVEVSVLRDSLNHVCSNPNCHPCAAYRAKIESILPPTPPSPSEADWKRWREEAKALSVGQGLFGSHEEHIWRDGYIARAEAEWRGKNGGAK